MSQIITQKRQSRLDIKLSLAKCDEGLRITVVSKKIGLMAKKLRAIHELKNNNGEFMSGEFLRLIRALNFYDRDTPQIVLNQIPTLRFLQNDDIINEAIIVNVFVDDEIREWIGLFKIYVKIMKKYIRRFELI